MGAWRRFGSALASAARRVALWADDARWYLLTLGGTGFAAWYLVAHPALGDAVATAVAKVDLSAVVPVVSVVIGAGLTYALAGRRELKKDIRDRILSTAYEAVREARELRSSIHTWGYHAPRGGGRIRPAGDPSAKWQRIPKAEAKQHDQAAVAAFTAITSSMDSLRNHVLDLSLVAPRELTDDFQNLADRTHAYIMSIGAGEIHRAADVNALLEDIETTINQVVRRVRHEVRGDRR